MLAPNPPGRPIEFNQETIQRILAAVPKVIVPSQVAGLSGVPKQRLSEWLIKGERDINLGIESLYAQLADGFKLAQAEICAEIITKLQSCPKNYGALTWTLEKCFKEDFESKSEYVKQLEDYVLNVIKPMMTKGGLENGIPEAKEAGEETKEAQV